MKQIRLHIPRFSVVQVAILILIAGVFIGVLFANLFRGSYFEQMKQYQDTIFSDIAHKDIDYRGLFSFVLGKNFKEFAIFWLLCATILGIPYMVFKILSFGFYTGFFISAVTMQYGFKGIILIFVYVFPHGLLYLPVTLLCLYKGYSLSQSIHNEHRNNLHSVIRLLRSQLVILILLAAILLIGSFLEAYVGAFFMKKILGMYL